MTVAELNQPLECYVHIYKVTTGAQGNIRHVSVATLGRTRALAEQVAINLVHQSGYHILATDTATAAPWLTEAEDLPYLDDLKRFGAALKEFAA